MEDRIKKDPRFSKILTDARFKEPVKRKEKKSEAEVTDDRFAAVFENPDFAAPSLTGKTDRRGKKREAKDKGDELREFYNVDKNQEKEPKDLQVDDDKAQKKNFARWGLGSDESSSSDSEDSSSYDEEADTLLAALVNARMSNADADLMDDDEPPTRRLACINLNWDLLDSTDILALLRGFCPPTGSIDRVTVMASRYGVERMEQENEHGPIMDTTGLGGYDQDGEEEDIEGSTRAEIQEARRLNVLRKYVLERRRYYFAIITCDSAATASVLYNECDGLEIDMTASLLDMRYVPDEQNFGDLPERDSATFVPQRYLPPQAVQAEDGLASTKVGLQWDETPIGRTKITMADPKAVKEMDEADYAHFLASDSDDSDSDDDDEELRIIDDEPESTSGALKSKEKRTRERIRLRYASLLEGVDSGVKEADNDMIVTFQSGLDEVAEDALRDKAEQEFLEQQTPFERQQAARVARKKDKKVEREGKIQQEIEEKDKERKERKRVEKKRARAAARGEEDSEEERERQELGLLVIGEKKKKKTATTTTMEIAEDDRFKSLLERPEYAIDRTDQRFKPTEAMNKLLGQMRESRPSKHVSSKTKSGSGHKEEGVEAEKGGSLDALVASVKRKSEQKLQKRSKSKGKRK